MLLRRSRQHFHGASNRSLSAQRIHALHPIFTTNQPENKKQNMQKLFTITTSHLKKRNIEGRKQNCSYFEDRQTYNTQKPCTTQSQLRRKYQGSRHIIKILNSWGVTSKGYLSRQQFKEQVKKKIGKNIQEQQLDKLFQRHSKNSDRIDVQDLINLFKDRTQGIPFNNRIFSTEESLPFRNKLVEDLSQNLKNFNKEEKKELTDYTLNAFIGKFNSAISKMKQSNEGHISNSKKTFFEQLVRLRTFDSFEQTLLAHIEGTGNFNQMRQLIVGNKSVDYLLADPILRNTRTIPFKHEQKKDAEQLQYTKHMQSSPQLMQNILTSQIKRKDFDPKTFYHINQMKTRFGNSLFIKESNGSISNQNKQPVLPNQKDQILYTLKIQQEMRKTRYQNKLQKIREWRSREIQNVAQRTHAFQQREQGKLLRVRQQQQAYNYVNFIKKRWE